MVNPENTSSKSDAESLARDFTIDELREFWDEADKSGIGVYENMSQGSIAQAIGVKIAENALKQVVQEAKPAGPVRKRQSKAKSSSRRTGIHSPIDSSSGMGETNRRGAIRARSKR